MRNSWISRGIPGSVAVIFLVNTVLVTPGAAQTREEATQAPMFHPTVIRGEDLIVTDTAGREHKGQLLDAGADGLLLAPARDRQVFRWSEVAEVRHRERDSPLNGFLIGLGAGMLGAVVARRALCSSPDPECEAIVDRVIVLPVIVGGAAMGALMDNIMKKEVVVYRAGRRGGGSAHLSVTPSIGPRVRGVHVAWTF